jgi:hypothetical protein
LAVKDDEKKGLDGPHWMLTDVPVDQQHHSPDTPAPIFYRQSLTGNHCHLPGSDAQ